jgi:uncharacterized membrane protein YjgN (DUF898 family)
MLDTPSPISPKAAQRAAQLAAQSAAQLAAQLADAPPALAAECAGGTEQPAQAAAPRPLMLRFTGSGAEYFRIWIVNLALSVLTLGIYSAWAKVRRLRYFDRNTELDGAVFDFDGDPKAILRGRIVALVLVGAYQYAFGFSLAVGIAVVTALIVALPFLMRGALRFRLGNTRYRGLRFHFTGSVKDSYGAYLPPMALFLSPAALAAIKPESLAALPLLYVLWPLMHGAMKRYQHGNIRYASLDSSMALSKRSFYRPYLGLLGVSTVSAIVATVCAVIVGGGIYLAMRGADMDAKMGSLMAIGLAALMFYLMYLMSGPYLQVRIGNMAWSATTFPGVRIGSTMRARDFAKLQTSNAILTLLTLGLYRPFAVVKAYEYRLAHLSISIDDSVETALCDATATRGSAGADGVADFLGVDLSW